MPQFEDKKPKPQSSAPSRIPPGEDSEAFSKRLQLAPELDLEIQALAFLLELYERTQKWEKATETAEKLCSLDSKNIGWWLQWAINAGRRAGGGAFATREILYAALQRFPGDTLILYNLACSSSQMGDFTAAWIFLEKTYGTADREEIRQQVGEEPQLVSLWAADSR